jgi:uncharacterized repeat protein (TIGR01451 family)
MPTTACLPCPPSGHGLHALWRRGPDAVAAPARGALRACLCIVLALAMAVPPPSPARAQDDPGAVRIAMAGFSLGIARDEDGEPLVDDDGAPVLIRIPLADSAVTPGDRVVFVIQLDNATDTAASEVTLIARIAAEVLFDPFSLTGPEDLGVAWAHRENPDHFLPLFDEVESTRVLLADLDALNALRLTLPLLAAGSQLSAEYAVTLR